MANNVPIFLYGVTIYNAIKKGNNEELQQLLTQARQTKQDQGDLDQAIADLEKALGGSGGTTGKK